MAFKNFKIWRGRLPHWRADGVTYYVTFRHRRDLAPDECELLLRCLLKPDGARYDVSIAAVLPGQTELIFKVHETATGEPYELAQIIETAKRKAGKAIIKKTGERFPPFYEESYDRIIRDEAEFEERWEAILGSPEKFELADAENWPGLWVAS
ncbi:MAG: hypothetical protein K1X67_11135 [Fimbriimonadaceae bacterium]|nr:hypothetical protein [Fimbriimonadaceae bacterium]